MNAIKTKSEITTYGISNISENSSPLVGFLFDNGMMNIIILEKSHKRRIEKIMYNEIVIEINFVYKIILQIIDW